MRKIANRHVLEALGRSVLGALGTQRMPFSTVMSTYPSLDMFDDVPNLASGVPLQYPYMQCTSLKQQQQQQDAKFQRGLLFPSTQEHCSPHFSEAWIINNGDAAESKRLPIQQQQRRRSLHRQQ